MTKEETEASKWPWDWPIFVVIVAVIIVVLGACCGCLFDCFVLVINSAYHVRSMTSMASW